MVEPRRNIQAYVSLIRAWDIQHPLLNLLEAPSDYATPGAVFYPAQSEKGRTPPDGGLHLYKPGEPFTVFCDCGVGTCLPSSLFVGSLGLLAVNLGSRHVRVVMRLHHEQEDAARALIYNFRAQVGWAPRSHRSAHQ